VLVYDLQIGHFLLVICLLIIRDYIYFHLMVYKVYTGLLNFIDSMSLLIHSPAGCASHLHAAKLLTTKLKVQPTAPQCGGLNCLFHGIKVK
jgi:hypothetical protein